MVAKNDENETQPELRPEDIYKCFWLLLNTVGGRISISAEHIEQLPETAEVTINYNKATRMWDFKIPKKKRKRGVIKPSRKLILPS